MTHDAGALREDEKQLLADQVLGGATPSTLMVRAVERILADRAEALRGEVERLERGSQCPQCCATEWNEASRQRARAEAAEAEAQNYAADYDRRGERLWRLAALTGYVPSESDNDATAEMVIADAIRGDRDV